jgi:hypothetical protein
MLQKEPTFYGKEFNSQLSGIAENICFITPEQVNLYASNN